MLDLVASLKEQDVEMEKIDAKIWINSLKELVTGTSELEADILLYLAYLPNKDVHMLSTEVGGLIIMVGHCGRTWCGTGRRAG